MSEMESNFDEIISNQKVVTSKVLDVLTQVLNLSDTCSYITADGAVYTLNIDPEKAVVYKNAKYALSGLSSAYEDIFYGNFEYKVCLLYTSHIYCICRFIALISVTVFSLHSHVSNLIHIANIKAISIQNV